MGEGRTMDRDTGVTASKEEARKDDADFEAEEADAMRFRTNL